MKQRVVSQNKINPSKTAVSHPFLQLGPQSAMVSWEPSWSSHLTVIWPKYQAQYMILWNLSNNDNLLSNSSTTYTEGLAQHRNRYYRSAQRALFLPPAHKWFCLNEVSLLSQDDQYYYDHLVLIDSWCTSPWGRPFLPPQRSLTFRKTPELSPIHINILLLSLFRSYLSSHVGKTLLG